MRQPGAATTKVVSGSTARALVGALYGVVVVVVLVVLVVVVVVVGQGT